MVKHSLKTPEAKRSKIVNNIKTKLTREDVLHVAKLSSLTLTDAEIKKFLPQLSRVVEYISQLSEVETQEVKPTSQTTGLVNIFREDQIKALNILPQDKALSGTDIIHNGLFKVPAILEGRINK